MKPRFPSGDICSKLSWAREHWLYPYMYNMVVTSKHELHGLLISACIPAPHALFSLH